MNYQIVQLMQLIQLIQLLELIEIRDIRIHIIPKILGNEKQGM